ncbi:hypothetical protein [Vibrio salinus]|uniref:hypothetical protein n=1 Tax=Vibrio salinus TaxID=2899784 RepID=UPI001E41FEED|nr:hypothetical protein [Vibrio salinus]MCE0495754.1 hypothetical protein [Vibrio salinus]
MKWIVLCFWLFLSSGYLYLLNFAVPESASFNGYFLFTVILAGGGLSYDIASKMFAIPSYRGHWSQLLKRMVWIVIGHGLVLGGIFLAGYFSNIYSHTIANSIGITVSVIGLILSCYHAYQAEYTFKSLRNMFS